ncbi:MAG: 5'-nucleotidase C-terminal domain-containing protein [Planctomycetota bacterium]
MNTRLDRVLLFALALLLAVGCREPAAETASQAIAESQRERKLTSGDDEAEPHKPGSEAAADEIAGEWLVVDDELTDDTSVEALIAPYREKLQAAMQEEIGVAEAVLERGRPESPLGHFIADSILHHARTKIDSETDLAVMNRGGIRLPQLPAGTITVADIYQLVPFDNRIVVLTLRGSQVESLLEALVAQQGEPMSGITYQIQRDTSGENDDAATAVNVRIGSAPLDREATYKLATLDYLAGIGGEFAALQDASERLDGEPFLRDVMIDRIRELKSIEPVTDGRVSYVQNDEN